MVDIMPVGILLVDVWRVNILAGLALDGAYLSGNFRGCWRNDLRL